MLLLGTILTSKKPTVAIRHVDVWNRPGNRGVRCVFARQYAQLEPEQIHPSLIEMLWHKHQVYADVVVRRPPSSPRRRIIVAVVELSAVHMIPR